MKIAIIDADLVCRKKHRFPNLVCMKLSAYYQDSNTPGGPHEVCLETDFKKINDYDKVFISKVFTDTKIPAELDQLFLEYKDDPDRINRRVQFGGTGFYFDKAPDLDNSIEHHRPDYELYFKWIEDTVNMEREKNNRKGKEFNEQKFRAQFKEYTEYSIGFLTRGCFRKCPFCVNQKYSHVFRHSPLAEFYDESKKKICLLDDNFFGFQQNIDSNGVNHSKPEDLPAWKELLKELKATGKPFKFKQGLDERLLTHEMCEELFNSNYDGDFTFAFDKIVDYDLIHQKLEMIRNCRMRPRASIRFYVLVGFTYGESRPLEASDIEDDFRRIELLMKYRCLPYIMRYQSKEGKPWKSSRYSKIYVEMARWCNQPSFFKKKSFREYCYACEKYHHANNGRARHSSTWQAFLEFQKENPGIAKRYFDLKFGEIKRLVGEPAAAKKARKAREVFKRK